MKKTVRYTTLFFIGSMMLLALTALAHAATDVGTVISARPGVFALRGGKVVPLAVKDRVMDTDVLYTNATGRVQVILDDDSTISLASDTRLELLKVVSTGKPEFKANVSTGLARFITGKIVEQNPEGFSVSTPKGTVGIRGTIFSVRADDGTVTIYVTTTTTGGVSFGGSVIPSGSKMTIGPDGSMTVTPMAPTENDAIETQVQAGLASGKVVASGETTTTDGQTEITFGLMDNKDEPTVTVTNTPQMVLLVDNPTPLPIKDDEKTILSMDAKITGKITVVDANSNNWLFDITGLNVNLLSGASKGLVTIPKTASFVNTPGVSSGDLGGMFQMNDSTGAYPDVHIGFGKSIGIDVVGRVSGNNLSLSGIQSNLQTGDILQHDNARDAAHGSFSGFQILETHSSDLDYVGVNINASVSNDTKQMAIDRGTGDLSFKYSGSNQYGSTNNNTPNINKAASEGAVLSTPITNVTGSGPVTVTTTP